MPESGQAWTTLAELAADRRPDVREDEGILGVGVEPAVGIGQRALLVPLAGGPNLMWDCVPLVSDELAQAVADAGGLAGIAISHPHFHSTMAEWAHRFDCPVYLHAADRPWVMRPDPALELWEGETREIEPGLTLVRAGGHFPGGTVLHWAEGPDGTGALLAGDIVMVIPDRGWVSFMWSYPNLIPLGEADMRAVAAAVAPYDFERIYAAWWGRVVPEGGAVKVRRSAERYARALRGEYPAPPEGARGR